MQDLVKRGGADDCDQPVAAPRRVQKTQRPAGDHQQVVNVLCSLFHRRASKDPGWQDIVSSGALQFTGVLETAGILPILWPCANMHAITHIMWQSM
jgi:hypothetical protein